MRPEPRTLPLPTAIGPAAILLLRNSLRPAALAAAVGAAAIAPLALLLGRPVEGILLGVQWVLAFSLSMVVHELAHVAAARPSDDDSWDLEVRWTGLSVVGPAQAIGIRSALAGPLAGAAVTLVGAAAGLSAWVTVPLVALHLVNLTPICPDGRVLAELA